MRYHLIKQQDETDCGAACIATIAKHYGKRISVARVRNLAGTDTKGTSGKGIIKAANALGFNCKALISVEKKLKPDLPLPIIAHINRDGLEHYIVIYKIRRRKILVADPAKSVLWADMNTFYEWWTGIFFFIVPGSYFEKTNDDKSLFRRFRYLLLQNKCITVEAISASFILTLLGIFGAFYFRYLIDDVIYTYLPQTLFSVSLGYLIVLIFQSLLGYSRSSLIIFLGNKLEASLTLEYFNHILHLPLDFFMKRKSGEILSRLNDIGAIKNALAGMTVSIILDCVMLIFGGIFLFTFSPMLVAIAAIPVIMSATSVLFSSGLFKELIHSRSIAEAEKYSHFVETINGISTIKALSSEDESMERAEDKIIESIEKGLLQANLGNSIGILHGFFSQAGNLAVYWYGSWLIMKGQLSLGELISFTTILGYFLGPLGRLITLQPQIQELLVSGKRLDEILELPAEEDSDNGKFEINSTDGNISIKNLTFSYGTRGNTLENISLEIQGGQKVAFVGPSGSGKTTLIKLLMKFYFADSGEICLDGKNIKDINTTSYRKFFGYVPQEILLFSGTVEENISWGNHEVKAEDVFNAAKDAEALEFISRLDGRFSAKVGECGASLSGGERQRLALARILLRKPQILVLDEATLSLDSISESTIMRTIGRIGEKTTTIIVAHRLSTIKNCDKIFVMKNGHLAESGTHRELMKKNSVYAQMWKSQTQEP